MVALYTRIKAEAGRKTPFTLILQAALTRKTHFGDRTPLARTLDMQTLSIAAAGMMNAQTRFDASARRTAAAPLDDLAGATVERLQAKTTFGANAAVARTADDMTGTLLDILA
jgi:hypothetical protein